MRESTEAEREILDLIYGDEESLLELYFGEPWAGMLHESYEELDSVQGYPRMGKSNMGPHDREAPDLGNLAWAAMAWGPQLHEADPYHYMHFNRDLPTS